MPGQFLSADRCDRMFTQFVRARTGIPFVTDGPQFVETEAKRPNQAGDADEEYAKSVSIREINQQFLKAGVFDHWAWRRRQIRSGSCARTVRPERASRRRILRSGADLAHEASGGNHGTASRLMARNERSFRSVIVAQGVPLSAHSARCPCSASRLART